METHTLIVVITTNRNGRTVNADFQYRSVMHTEIYSCCHQKSFTTYFIFSSASKWRRYCCSFTYRGPYTVSFHWSFSSQSKTWLTNGLAYSPYSITSCRIRTEVLSKTFVGDVLSSGDFSISPTTDYFGPAGNSLGYNSSFFGLCLANGCSCH